MTMTTAQLIERLPDSFLLKYIQEIEAGRIGVGRDLWAMLEKLKAAYTNERYKYDPKEAIQRIRFIERECKHFEAPWAGKPFLLLLWEKAFIDSFYSFKVWDEEVGRWIRRFKKGILIVARKNGKTPLMAAIGLAEFFCGETGTKILCGSNDYSQASIVFDAMNAMREESPTLERVSRKNIRGIFMGNMYRKNQRGKFSYQNKGNIQKLSSRTSSKEGRNLKCGIIDEAHEMQDNRLVEPIEQSLSTQEEPILFIISSEGLVKDGYLDLEIAECKNILSGEVDNDTWDIWLYTQDSEEEVWQDEDSWIKSNPSLGPVKKITYLRDRIKEAQRSPSKRAFTLAKDFNLKQNAAVAWLTYEQIHNEEKFSLEDFRNWPCLGGCDFAETTDLCAADVMFRVGTKSYVHPHFWIPEAKADIYLDDGAANALNPEQRDYRRWAAEGFVTIVPGNEINVSAVADWYYDLYLNFGILPFKVGYDNRFALEFRRRFEYLLGEDIAENVSQTAVSLSAPMRGLEADLTSHNVVHNNHPILIWNLENTSVETDQYGYIKPRKNFGNPKNRIDGSAALLNTYAMYQRNRVDYLLLIEQLVKEKADGKLTKAEAG